MKLTWNEEDIGAGNTVWIKTTVPVSFPYVKLTIIQSDGGKGRDGRSRPARWLLFNTQNNHATRSFASRRAMAQAFNREMVIPDILNGTGYLERLHNSWVRDNRPAPVKQAAPAPQEVG